MEERYLDKLAAEEDAAHQRVEDIEARSYGLSAQSIDAMADVDLHDPLDRIADLMAAEPDERVEPTEAERVIYSPAL